MTLMGVSKTMDIRQEVMLQETKTGNARSFQIGLEDEDQRGFLCSDSLDCWIWQKSWRFLNSHQQSRNFIFLYLQEK